MIIQRKKKEGDNEGDGRGWYREKTAIVKKKSGMKK